jgi:transcriptional regulator with XRE-family HTH domain
MGQLGIKMNSDVTIVLGSRLREMRKMRGLSLRDQARALGVSPSTLSELERGIAGISLQRLQSVAASLSVSVADLLSHDTPSEPPERTLEVLSSAEVEGGSIQRGRGAHYALVGAAGEHALQPYRIAFDAGGGYADDPISHPGEEFVYVALGNVLLHLDGEPHTLRQGDHARFDSSLLHAFSNASTASVALIVGAGTPPW